MEVSKAIPQAVDLSRIVSDFGLQVRKKETDRGVVKQYAAALEQGKEFPPVTLAAIGGVLYCLDGFHRIEANKLAGRRQVDALILEGLTMSEAAWKAAEANLTHGLRLKGAEVREAFRRYVKAGQHRRANGRYKSYRDIAGDLGGVKRHQTINNWMKKDFKKIAAAMGDRDHAERQWSTQEASQGPTVVERVEAALDTARNYMGGIEGAEERARIAGRLTAMAAEATAGQPANPLERAPF